LLLTKRPENIKSMWWGDLVTGFRPKSRKNVWLGTTVENQEYADKRIPELLKCRDLTPVLFLSVEPMLGPVDLRNIQVPSVGYKEGPDRSSDDLVDSLSGEVCSGETGCVIAEDQPTIDWVIVGCESGPKRRKTELSWVRSLRDQCQAAGTAFFVKQLEVDGKVTDNIEDFPEDLRIQEFPNATHSTTSKQASPRST
jgi:protein gp37